MGVDRPEPGWALEPSWALLTTIKIAKQGSLYVALIENPDGYFVEGSSIDDVLKKLPAMFDKIEQDWSSWDKQRRSMHVAYSEQISSD